jgi:hypothetical protein
VTEPSTGKGSRRYRRYEQSGLDVAQGHDEPEKKAKPKKPTKAEEQRQHDKDHNNLNKGLPLHRGSDQATYDAVVKGQHGSEPEGTAEERARAKQISGTNHGKPEHKGFTAEDKARLEAAARHDLEVE